MTLELTEKDIKALLAKLPQLKSEIQKVIVGQDHILDELLVAFLAGGDCLLEGGPGLAKTLIVKTMSALLEAMQEFEVTYGGETYPLDRPFFILATQNPIEQAGTYPLPEAQLDRFLLLIKIGYPTDQEEFEVLNRTTGTNKADVK